MLRAVIGGRIPRSPRHVVLGMASLQNGSSPVRIGNTLTIRTVVKITKTSEASKVATMKTLNEDVLKLHSKGEFTQASYAADYAIQKAKELFGDDHVALASAFANRGFIAKELGDYEDAVELYELALHVYEKQDKAQHGKTVVLQNLGNVLRTVANQERNPTKKKEFRERAKVILEQAVEAIKASDGDNSLKYASALQKLANVNKDIRDFATAELLLRTAMQTAETVDAASRVLFSIKNDLGLVLKLRGDSFDEARELYESALEYAINKFGETHKETIIYKHNLAELLDTNEATKHEATRLRMNILLNDPSQSHSS